MNGKTSKKVIAITFAAIVVMLLLGGVGCTSATITNEGVTQLTNSPEVEGRSCFSPDESKIAFSRYPYVDMSYIYIMDLDGTNEELLVKDGYDPYWKPDMSKMIYKEGSYTSYIREVEYPGGSNKVRLTSSGSDTNPKYNFDGSKIVFRSRRAAGNDDVWVMNSDGSNQVRLTDDPADDNQPWWSPEGTKVVYGVGYSLWVMNSDGTNKQQLTLPGNGDQHAIYSPNGKYIAFTSARSGNSDIWVMNADGTNPVQLTTDSSADEAVDWSPDGRKILFTSSRSGNSDLWVMTLGGITPTPTVTPSPMDIQAEIRNIWTSDTMSPIVLFGQNANLGQVVQADLDANSFSDSLPNWDSRCLGPKNYDKSIVSRFREGNNKVRIVVDITGGTGFNPGSEGYIKIINPDYKITKIFGPSDSDYIGAHPPTNDMHTHYSGFGVIIDAEGGSISWQGRGGCPACGCRENFLPMEFLVEKVDSKEDPISFKDLGITPPTQSLPTNGPITAGINDKIGIWYSIKNTDTSNRDVKLITKIRNQDTGEIIPDPTNDKVVTLAPSDTRWYSRSFVIPSGMKAGIYDVLYSIYKPDQSDKYDETWKAGWLIVDTDTYTVSLRSSANDGSLNIGSIRVDTATYNLPSEVTKQYRMNEYYYVEAIAPTGYNFDKWETIGGVSVNDIGNGFGILSVTGAGTLNAVFKKAPTFEIILDPSSILLNPGEKGFTLVNVKSLNGFSGGVELTLGWDEASSNWFSNVNFDPKIVTMTSGEQVISELSFDLSSSATPGVYNMHVGATDLQRQCQSKYENLQLSVKGTTTQDPVLANWEITPTMAKAGDTVELHYYIYNPNSQSLEVTLGVTMRDSTGQEMADKTNDIDVTVTPGRNWYKRSFVIDPNTNTGYYDVMWGIHKAHLAGMYDKSGWQENRLEITTAKTLDDLLEAEQMLYENRRKMIEDYTRQMVCDYVYFDNNFDFNLFESAARTLTSAGIATLNPIDGFALSIVHGIISEDWKSYSNEQISNVCWTDDTLYTKTLNEIRQGLEDGREELKINDIEKLAQIEKSHKDFINFINNYDTTHKDEKELEVIIQEQINIFNSNHETALDNNPLLLYHDGLYEIKSGVHSRKQMYHWTTITIGSGGCLIAIGATVSSMGAAIPLLSICGASVALISGGGDAVIDLKLNENMLGFIAKEFDIYHRLLDTTSNEYINILSGTQSALNNNVEHLPRAKLLSIDASNTQVGEITPLILKFSNLGSSNLQAKGYFDIYKNGEYFATLETPQYTIVSGNTEDLSASFRPPSDGEYAIYGYVIYENIRTEKLATQISVAPVTGAIVVNTNNANAKFTIIGLQSFSGDGSSWSTTEALIGTYKIIFDPIEGYDTPPSQELVLTPDSTITFTGDYVQQTITYSITLNSNRADIPLIVDGEVIYHDELPKAFTWSKNSEHTIKAQTEVYKDVSTKYVFVKWDDGNTDSERKITVNSDKTYNAEYKTRYYLSLKTNPENIGTVFGAGWYDVNSPAEITAPVIIGYAFTGWTVDDSTVVGNPIMITMDASHNAVANYRIVHK